MSTIQSKPSSMPTTINIYGGDNNLQIHATDSSTPIVCNIYGGQNLILPEVKVLPNEKQKEREKNCPKKVS